MNMSEARSTRRWPARTLLVALMLVNLAACWLAAKGTFEVATDRYIGFSNPYTAGALLAATTAAVAAAAWLAILAWNSRPPRRLRLSVAYVFACAALWAAAVCLALSTVDNSY
jgi:hypothetical protein